MTFHLHQRDAVKCQSSLYLLLITNLVVTRSYWFTNGSVTKAHLPGRIVIFRFNQESSVIRRSISEETPQNSKGLPGRWGRVIDASCACNLLQVAAFVHYAAISWKFPPQKPTTWKMNRSELHSPRNQKGSTTSFAYKACGSQQLKSIFGQFLSRKIPVCRQRLISGNCTALSRLERVKTPKQDDN